MLVHERWRLQVDMQTVSSVANVTHAAVAILIQPDGQVLLGKRPEGKPWAGWWEFPGGKIEAGESPLQGLQRELEEELGVVATRVYPWLTRSFDYPEKTVKLHFFRVLDWAGPLHGREGQTIAWQSLHQLTVDPVLPANAPIFKALNLPDVLAITNLQETEEPLFFAQLQRQLQYGLKFIQIREKHLDAATLSAFAAKVVQHARDYGAKVVLNGEHLDVIGHVADGVHLTSRQLRLLDQKPDLPLVGASCHNEEELAMAARLDLDYVTLSPVSPTLSHPEAPAIGWTAFAELVRDYALPVYALGGMQQEDLEYAWQHGAHGLAIQRSVWQP